MPGNRYPAIIQGYETRWARFKFPPNFWLVRSHGFYRGERPIPGDEEGRRYVWNIPCEIVRKYLPVGGRKWLRIERQGRP